jgi:hypothetical protein
MNRGVARGEQRTGGVIVPLEPPGDHAPLHGEITRTDAFIAGQREVLVGAEADRAMIHDHMARRRAHRHRVVAVGGRDDPAAHAQEAQDDVIASDRQLGPANPDASTGRGLPRDREVVGCDAQVTRERDPAAHLEHDRAVADAHAIAQRARARVIELRDVTNAAAAAAVCESPKPLGARKGELLTGRDGLAARRLSARRWRSAGSVRGRRAYAAIGRGCAAVVGPTARGRVRSTGERPGATRARACARAIGRARPAGVAGCWGRGIRLARRALTRVQNVGSRARPPRRARAGEEETEPEERTS